MDRLIFRAESKSINKLLKQKNLKRFEPKKITASRPEKPMRQPANLDMFYGLSDSRIWDDKARLPRNWLELPER
ncbi:hypothetical protein D8T62_22125 [Vibrio vulnificus]|nr:hypothetical protein D8T62_22125 [Vibrio vulnificus]